MKKKQSDFIKCSLCSFWRTIRIYDRYIYLTNPFRISQFQSGISNLHDGCFLITIRNVEVYTFIHVLLNIQVTFFRIYCIIIPISTIVTLRRYIFIDVMCYI